MIPVKINFRGLHTDVWCSLCSADRGGDREEDSQQHLLECQAIIDNCPDVFNDYTVQYQDIFSVEPSVQLAATRLLQSALETRERLIS